MSGAVESRPAGQPRVSGFVIGGKVELAPLAAPQRTIAVMSSELKQKKESWRCEKSVIASNLPLGVVQKMKKIFFRKRLILFNFKPVGLCCLPMFDHFHF